jgi:hypothetical protein
MARSDLTPEKLDEYRAHGGRITKCPPRAVQGAGYIVEYWRGSFYPVMRGGEEKRLDGERGKGGRKRRG